MADTLKVFKNENVVADATGDATSIPLYTTANETIVLKDVQLEMTELEAGDEGFYSYPTTLQVDGVKQGPPVNLAGASKPSTPLSMTGSQIVGPNSEVTLEIEEEASLTDYGYSDALFSVDNSGIRFFSLNMSSTSPALTGASAILDNGIAAMTNPSGAPTSTGYSGGVVTSGGVKKFGWTTGSYLHIVDGTGSLLASWNFPTTSYACAADDTYFYLKPSSSQAYLQRFNHVTMEAASNLTLTGSQDSYGTSNKGWCDVFRGHFYYRSDGSSTTTRKINLATGATVTHTIGNFSQSEFLGGIINTNVNGLTMVVMYGDTTMSCVGIPEDDTDTNYTYNNQNGAFSTNPTTTNGNTVMSLAPGVIWVNNGSYDQNLIVDTNGMNVIGDSYTQTVTSNAVQVASSGSVFIGGHHQEVAAKTRKMGYRVTASGITST